MPTLVILLASVLASDWCSADEVQVEINGKMQTMTVAPSGGGGMPTYSAPVPTPVPPGGGPQVPPGGPPGGPPATPDKDKKPGDKPEEKGKKPPEEGPKTVTRPNKPPKDPNPDELKILPDASGRYRPQWKNQSWEHLLEWLAEKSKMSLDWNELPGDYLNLATEKHYTVAELRSMINRDLLSRGYTIVCNGERMTVLNLKKLDPSLVPRVKPEELDKLEPSDFVRVMFQLNFMSTDDAVEAIKPFLNPTYGKSTALKGANRLEVIDSVANLRDIANFLRQEQSPEIIKQSFKVFTLKHARADDIRQQLLDLLDLGKGAGGKMPPIPPGMNPEQVKQMMEAQQKAGQGKPPQAPGAEPVVSLVVNARKNSLVVNAPPDKMALIDEAITILDVPSEVSANLLSNVPYMKVYRIVGVDPQPVIKTLQEIGGLSPTAKLEIDKRGNIIAYASLADHVIIRKLVQDFSGTERKFEVVSLRQLNAADVAGTIMYMLGKEKKKETRRRPWWDDYSRDSDEKPDEFRVDADVERNRLLLWANEVELTEVNNLLRKLGEQPPDEDRRGPVRILDVGGTDNAQEVLQRIRQMWPASNPLLESSALPAENPAPETTPPEKNPIRKLPVAPTEENGERIRSAEARPWSRFPVLAVSDSKERPKEGIPEAERNATIPGNNSPVATQKPGPSLVSEKPGQPPVPPAAPNNPPPVKITISPSGQIIIASDDPKALDLFEDLAGQLSVPAKRSYEIIHLNWANAYNVSYILEDFFKEEAKKAPRRVPYWYEMEYGGDSKDDASLSLAKRPMLKFIADPDSNSILVHGADAKQLKQIKDLIAFYDKVPAPSDKTQRITKPVHLVHSKAKVVYETIKEVYRDLLSDKDKAFQGKQDNRSSYMDSYWVMEGGDDSKSAQLAPKFKGQLSIGVDELSNTLIVSAPKYLFDDVNELIQALDKEAEPMADFQVVRLPNGLRGPDLQKTLSDVLAGKKAAGASPGDASHSHRRSRDRGRHSQPQ